jgi:hypothetical protein
MSGTVYNPPVGHWGELRVGDTDTRTKNFAPDLSQIPDTISSVTAHRWCGDGCERSGGFSPAWDR